MENPTARNKICCVKNCAKNAILDLQTCEDHVSACFYFCSVCHNWASHKKSKKYYCYNHHPRGSRRIDQRCIYPDCNELAKYRSPAHNYAIVYCNNHRMRNSRIDRPTCSKKLCFRASIAASNFRYCVNHI